MSGGSYDYLCYKIEDAAESLHRTESDSRRSSFQKLLRLISKAMHDIEWVDSCDYGNGDDYASIDAVFEFLGTNPELIKKAHSYDALKEKLLEYLK